jgi:hypothetical protein
VGPEFYYRIAREETLEDAVIAGALFAKQLALEERQVVLGDGVKIAMPKPLAAPGALSGLGFHPSGSRSVFAPLAFWRPVGAIATRGLQVDDVGMFSAAGRYRPDIRLQPNDLLKALLRELYSALKSAG